MPDKSPYNYAVIRVVPLVEREEFVNAGVIIFCKAKRFLQSRIHLDEQRVRSLSGAVDIEEARDQLRLIPRICVGGNDAGPLGEKSQSERFHWLTSPKSTIIQTSAVHSGLCKNPAEELEELFTQLVLPI